MENNSENKPYSLVLCKGLNELSKTVHNRAVEKGFWDNKKEIGTLLMLCVSELGEALESDRRSKYANLEQFENSLPGCDTVANASFQENIKDTFEDEIADTIIRLLDMCGNLGIDIDKHINYKLGYNLTRGNKHGKSY